MKVHVVSRKLIKPCNPTPSYLRTYKISVFDEENEPAHVFRILYFSGTGKERVSLEEPLAKVLTLYYPFAGRFIKNKAMVFCNDEGALYAEAEVNGDLIQVVNGEVDYELLPNLLPLELSATDGPTDPILAVQINRFRCGGIAIGVCCSHRVVDSASLGIFLQAWATAAVGELSDVIPPDFSSSSLFPAENLPSFDLSTASAEKDNDPVVVRRFVFDKNAISILRDKFSPNWKSSSSYPPSRIVVVSAFFTIALLRTDRRKQGKNRPSVISQAINIRERTVPPIPKHAIGTWVSSTFIEYTANQCRNLERDFPGVVMRMRESMMQGVKDCARILSDEMFGRWILIDSNYDAGKKQNSGEYKVIWMTDWSKFGEYELDFGFGKPVWVSLADGPIQDLVTLMNNKENDGLEAWVYLRTSDMDILLQDEELKMLTSTSSSKGFRAKL